MAWLLCSSLAFAQTPAAEANHPHARYLANEGLMVVHGDTKVLFDPLFRKSFGQYQLLPEPMQQALYAGKPPYDGIDAVFISHYHGDHFSPADILHLLKAQPGIVLYAPTQAVVALHDVAAKDDADVFDRVIAVDLVYKQTPVTLEMEGLLIEAVRIPHSGWPGSRREIENIAWRVTLDDTTTVLHMGDADPNEVHFADDAAFWDKNHPDMAFPPYWFFTSRMGNGILKKYIQPTRSIGVHVPRSVGHNPANRPAALRGYDLFTRPGESRRIPLKQVEPAR